MHPPLSLHRNPLCEEQIKALEACHVKSGYFGRAIGTCNDVKQELDKCFRWQKKTTRKAHLEEARAARARWREACAALESKKQNS